jgi:Na+/proline symporter
MAPVPNDEAKSTRAQPTILLIALTCAGLLGMAVACGLLFDLLHAYAGTTAVGLCGLPAILTVWLTLKLARTNKYGGLLGMAVGLFLRLAVAVGVGLLVFLVVPEFKAWKFGYWGWIIGVYLVVLVVETAVLARAITTVKPQGRL